MERVRGTMAVRIRIESSTALAPSLHKMKQTNNTGMRGAMNRRGTRNHTNSTARNIAMS